MPAEPPESTVTEGGRTLEVRWIFPGQLDAAVAGWFGRFPVQTESREDTYLLDPRLRGLSVKVRGGGALEVKVYRDSPGILEVAGRARGRLESWQKWSFRSARPAPIAASGPAGVRYARGGASAGSPRPAARSWRASRGRASSRSAGWNSPRSACVARTGGPSASRRAAPPGCSATNCRPPPRSCSPRPCPGACNPAPMTPGPLRSGCASSRVPEVTPASETVPPRACWPVDLRATPGTGPTGNAQGDITAADHITRRCVVRRRWGRDNRTRCGSAARWS